MKCNLESPFKEAFERGDSIDYKSVPGSRRSDHDVAREMGYEPHMNSDCSYSAAGLPGLSLTSYGDWGTIFVDWANKTVKKMFLDMCNEGIIVPWRVRTYIHEGKDVITYDYDERGWTKYDKTISKWVSTTSPYTK